MNKILNIAQFEFLSVVTEKAYLLSLLSLPLIFGVLFALLQARSLGEAASATEGHVGIIDRLGLIQGDEPSSPSPARPSNGRRPQRFDDLQTALQRLQGGTLDILYVIDDKYLDNGEIEIYGRETRHLRGSSPTGFSQLSVELRAGLLRRLLPDRSSNDPALTRPADRLIAAPTLKKLTVESNGAISPMRSSWERLSAALAPFSVAILLGLSIYFSSASLLESTVEESKNRVMEILLSSVREDQLIWGKLLGLGKSFSISC
jgi:ABC-type Na+ efflux pump permease subunit